MTHYPGPGLFDLFPRTQGKVLFFGTFDAAPDREAKGRAILEDTESHGWGRPARKASVERASSVARTSSVARASVPVTRRAQRPAPPLRTASVGSAVRTKNR